MSSEAALIFSEVSVVAICLKASDKKMENTGGSLPLISQRIAWGILTHGAYQGRGWKWNARQVRIRSKMVLQALRSI